jgi:recombination protein RecT
MANIEKAKQALTTEQAGFKVALENAFSKASHIVLDPKRLISIVYSQFQRNPDLSKCTIPSIVVSVLACAELGLEPGYKAYLIPYKNGKNNTTECHFQVGYKGLIDLFYRHPSSNKIEVQTVHTGDVFDFEYGTNAFIKHIPSKESIDTVIAYYAVAKLKNETVFKVMFPEEIKKHGLRYSKMVDRETGDFKYNSLWKTDFDSMAKKTVLIQLMKTLPNVSQEIEHALEADRVERQYDDRYKSVFEMPKQEEVIDTEGEVVNENPVPSQDSVKPTSPSDKVKSVEELIEDKKKIEAEKSLPEEEKKNKQKLNFLEALAKEKKIALNLDYFELTDSEKISLLERETKNK